MFGNGQFSEAVIIRYSVQEDENSIISSNKNNFHIISF
jgi:hypothetical protein